MATSNLLKNLLVEVGSIMTSRHQAENLKSCTCAHNLKALIYVEKISNEIFAINVTFDI